MPPEVVRILEALPLAVLVLLLVPKRGVSDVGSRLADLGAGRRRWLFEPPRGWGTRRPTGAHRALAEGLRAFELGAPLYVAARFAETRSAHARLEARQGWASTSQALFAAHFSGALSETELLGQLQYRALPLPAEKAIAPKFQPRPAMSIQWWLDHQVTKIVSDVAPSATGDGARPLDEAAPALEPDPPPLLVQRRSPLGPTYLAINTLGRIELRQGEEDFGPELLGRPVVAFLWLYLLIRALTGPRDRLMRVDIANELTPGMPADKQRTRLRNRLSDMMRKLPKPLAERMVVDHDESVKLDLSRCSIDLLRLEAIAAECTAKDGILSPDLAAEAAALLDTTAGEFLPGWEQLENEVNGGRGSAGELVAQLRQRAESARISVMGALAANHLARREPARAVPLLEQALERQPDREDLARKLRAAYLETGQLGRAADLQRLHGFQG